MVFTNDNVRYLQIIRCIFCSDSWETLNKRISIFDECKESARKIVKAKVNLFHAAGPFLMIFDVFFCGFLMTSADIEKASDIKWVQDILLPCFPLWKHWLGFAKKILHFLFQFHFLILQINNLLVELINIWFWQTFCVAIWHTFYKVFGVIIFLIFFHSHLYFPPHGVQLFFFWCNNIF